MSDAEKSDALVLSCLEDLALHIYTHGTCALVQQRKLGPEKKLTEYQSNYT